MVDKVEPSKGDMPGRHVKGGEPRAQSNGMSGLLLCCEMVRGEVQCTEKQNDRTEDI